jgi:glycosyltransferase involved in cell wall biosynthesis
MNPLVSIIIPAYNSSRFVEETIDSVLNQSFKNFEIIIVDDGSSDGQFDLIFPFCQKDERVRYIYQLNKGVSGARNTGFNHSSGYYVAFLDADDIWLSDNLSTKLAKFEEDDCGLVHSDGCFIDENSAPKEGLVAGEEGALLTGLLEWKKTQIPAPSSILVKREVLETTGLFDTNLSTSADRDFFLRVASRYKIGRVHKPTWKYRLHDSNMHKNIQRMERDMLYVYKKASLNNLFKSRWFKRKSYATLYMILAASWAGDGRDKFRATYFVGRAFVMDPGSLIEIVRHIIKKWL